MLLQPLPDRVAENLRPHQQHEAIKTSTCRSSAYTTQETLQHAAFSPPPAPQKSVFMAELAKSCFSARNTLLS